MTEYERPNTVAGLVAKHKELLILRDRHRAEIKKLTVDIDHLDACIRLFDPNADTPTIKAYVTVTKHRAVKGSVKRFVLNTFREALEPMTSRQLTELWVQQRGLVADEATLTIIRKRVGACIKTCVNQDLIECVGLTTDHGAFGPYKRWQFKEGRLMPPLRRSHDCGKSAGNDAAGGTLRKRRPMTTSAILP